MHINILSTYVHKKVELTMQAKDTGKEICAAIDLIAPSTVLRA